MEDAQNDRKKGTQGSDKLVRVRPLYHDFLVVLTESSSGYTIRFKIYTGKTITASEHELSYNVVMHLIRPPCHPIYIGTIFTPVLNC